MRRYLVKLPDNSVALVRNLDLVADGHEWDISDLDVRLRLDDAVELFGVLLHDEPTWSAHELDVSVRLGRRFVPSALGEV